MSRTRVACVAALTMVAVALGGCGRDQPPQVGTTIIDVADRELLPPVAGTTLDGSRLDLAALGGRVVVLNSWTSWCGPCRNEMPALVALSDGVDPADVVVVGLNVRDAPAAAVAFSDELGVSYPSIVDAEGAILRTIPGVPPAALPSTVIIDRDGRVAVRIIGEVNPTQLAELVEQVAAPDPRGSSPS